MVYQYFKLNNISQEKSLTLPTSFDLNITAMIRVALYLYLLWPGGYGRRRPFWNLLLSDVGLRGNLFQN